MIQAGSQPLTLNSLVTKWVRDWAKSPHVKAAMDYFEWYAPLIENVSGKAADS